MKDSVLILQTPEKMTRAISLGLKINSQFDPIFMDDVDKAIELCHKNSNLITSVVVGTENINPIQTIQKIHSADKNLPIIVLAKKINFETLKKSVSFSPFVGSSTFCHSEDESAALIPLIEKLSSKAMSQRISRKVFSNVNKQFDISRNFQSHSISSSQYIERLFDSAPIGIITVDSEGRILSLNRASSEMLRISEVKALGEKIIFFFPNLKLKENKQSDLRIYDFIFDLTITPVTGMNQDEGYLLMFSDVTVRKTNEEALNKAITSRDEFISVASHELRTPVTSLKLQLQLSERKILAGDQSFLQPEKLSKVFNIAIKQVNRLNLLVEDLLDITRIESGQMTFKFESAELTDITTSLIDRFSDEYKTRIKLLPSLPIWIDCDPFRIDQVITNLISNAIRYGEGSLIHVSLSVVDNEVSIKVKDQGLGIAEDKIEMIFERFNRAIPNTNINGLGLGLYITKTIVKAHGGSILVASKLGVGSEFDIRLPLKQNM